MEKQPNQNMAQMITENTARMNYVYKLSLKDETYKPLYNALKKLNESLWDALKQEENNKIRK